MHHTGYPITISFYENIENYEFVMDCIKQSNARFICNPYMIGNEYNFYIGFDNKDDYWSFENSIRLLHENDTVVNMSWKQKLGNILSAVANFFVNDEKFSYCHDYKYYKDYCYYKDYYNNNT